jgi:hypothetical protein
MHRLEGSLLASHRFLALVLISISTAGTAGAKDAPAALSQRASIEIEQAGAFVLLPLPPSAYGQVQQPDLNDLRVVDARGQRVPFALLQPRAARAQQVEQQREATLYPLPARPAAGTPWPLPVQVVVQGDRVTLTPRGTMPSRAAHPPASPGWLFDLGDPAERGRDEPPPRSLRLAWSGPAEFSIGYTLEHSDELRQWRSAGSGQLMALASPGGPLTQPLVMLPEPVSRFVRLVWRADPAAAPRVTGAVQLIQHRRTQAQDTPVTLEFGASAEPEGPRLIRGARGSVQSEAPPGTLHFDLGGDLPLLEIDLALTPSEPAAGPTSATAAAAAQVVPVRVQGRSSVDERWRDLVHGVVYRIERDGAVLRSPPLALRARARFVRVTPDERAAPLDPAQTRLQVRAALASLVFAAQGEAPLSLLAGSPDMPAGALPVSTLIPDLESERARFGSARLGDWAEVPEAAAAARALQRWADWRPWLLWAVLVGGVAALGTIVWRLARADKAT